VKDLDQNKISLRGARGDGPDIEVGVSDPPEEGFEDRDSWNGRDEPIQIPTDGAPSWVVTMMILSAVTCVVIAGYYLLR
jgi:protein phosphatase